MQYDIVLDELVEFSQDKYLVNIYTIYQNSLDYPDLIVVRKFEIRRGTIKRTNKIKKFNSINDCKKYFEMHGLAFIPRYAQDDICVFGSYI